MAVKTERYILYLRFMVTVEKQQLSVYCTLLKHIDTHNNVG